MSKKITKAEKREVKRQKAKSAPKGAKLAGQIQKMKASKNYAKKAQKRKTKN